MTFNVFTGSPWSGFGHQALADDLSRQRTQLEMIQQIDPDILCFQELYDEKVLFRFQTALEKDYDCYFLLSTGNLPGILFLVSEAILALFLLLLTCLFLDLAALERVFVFLFSLFFVDMTIRFGGFTVLKGFLLGRPLFGEAVFWKRAKFTNYQSECYAIQFSSQAGDWLNNFRQRGFLQVFLQCNKTQVVLNVLNVHTNSGLDDSGRVPQTQQVVEEISKNASKFDVLICAGDFNAQPLTESVGILLKHGYTDCWHAKHPDAHGYTWDNENTFAKTGIRKIPNERVDFIFVSGKVDVTDCHLALNSPPYVSDHYSVLAHLACHKSEAPGTACPEIFPIQLELTEELQQQLQL